MSNVFHECPQVHDHWSSLRGDQPQCGQRMRGPEVSLLLSRVGSRSRTVLLAGILDIMKHMSIRIDLMTPSDWTEVCAIYEEGIATGLGTFETNAPSWDEWNAARFPHSRLVARGERVLGWAALRACD